MCLGQTPQQALEQIILSPALVRGAPGDLMPEMPLLPRGVFVLPGSPLGTGEIMGLGL
jgi:hypothetical protein